MNTSMILLAFLALCSMTYAHVTPSGGSRETSLRQGQSVVITWDSTLVAYPVAISVWDGERRSMTRIHQAYSSSHASYEWVIPDTMPAGSLYRFVVASAATPTIGHFSESFVAIHSAVPRVSSVGTVVNPLDLQVTPTPARDVLRVKWTEPDANNVTLSTTLGGTIVSWPCANGSTQQDVDVATIASGVYMLTVQYANGATVSRPVVVEH